MVTLKKIFDTKQIFDQSVEKNICTEQAEAKRDSDS